MTIYEREQVGNLVFNIRIFVNVHLHMAKSKVTPRLEETVFKYLMEMCRGKYFRRKFATA